MASQVYEHLMERILDMELEPFRELSEARLAAEFGISRTPVREALARLARRGLVDILPQRGTRVSPLSVDRIAQSRFIREALERPLARLAAEKMTPEISALLLREIALQQTFAALGDDQGFLSSDDRFHALIARAAGFETDLGRCPGSQIPHGQGAPALAAEPTEHASHHRRAPGALGKAQGARC